MQRERGGGIQGKSPPTSQRSTFPVSASEASVSIDIMKTLYNKLAIQRSIPNYFDNSFRSVPVTVKILHAPNAGAELRCCSFLNRLVDRHPFRIAIDYISTNQPSLLAVSDIDRWQLETGRLRNAT